MWVNVLFHELEYYFKKLISHFQFKFFAAAFSSLCFYTFGQFDTAIKAFIFLLVADFITGMWKAAKRKEISSWLSRRGWGKIMTYTIIIAVGHQMSKVGIPLRDLSIMWASATEAISLLENFQALGVYIPPFISEKLLKSKNKMEGK